jgi:modulator of FtsH protease HflK
MADAIPPTGNLRPGRPSISSEDASSQALSEALGSSLLFIRILGALLLGAFLFSCVFTVNPNEVAIVLRFGKPVGEGREIVRTNGLHFALPYPVDEIVRIGVGDSKLVRANSAWYSVDAASEAAGLTAAPNVAQLNPASEGHVITADGNILHVRASMRYRISDPVAYAFRFSSASNIIESALNNAIQWASVRYKADDIIYNDVAGFRDSVRQRVTGVIERTGLGVTIEGLDVERAAPGYVKEFFDAVIAAEQDRNKRINEAQGEYDRITRESEGEAKRVVSQGESAADQLVQSIAAEARFFEDQLPTYRQNPGLYRDRLRVEALTRILTNTPDKFFLPSRADGDRREIRINLNREPVTPKKPEPGR